MYVIDINLKYDVSDDKTFAMADRLRIVIFDSYEEGENV